jgi:hypothetical protein
MGIGDLNPILHGCLLDLTPGLMVWQYATTLQCMRDHKLHHEDSKDKEGRLLFSGLLGGWD